MFSLQSLVAQTSDLQLILGYAVADHVYATFRRVFVFIYTFFFFFQTRDYRENEGQQVQEGPLASQDVQAPKEVQVQLEKRAGR